MALVKLIILFCTFSICTKIAFGNDLVLSPGEVRHMSLSSEFDAEVSRKGVIDLQNEGDGVWAVRALRAGVVVVRWFAANGELRESRMVQVINTDVRLHAFPNWVCGLRGVVCERDRRVIKGQFENAMDWLQAKAWCQRHDDCWFRADLQQTSRDHVLAFLRSRTKDSGRWQVEEGRLIHRGRCQKSYLDQLKKQLGAYADAVDIFECQVFAEERYRLSLKLVAMTRDTAARTGIDVKPGTANLHAQNSWQLLAESLRYSSNVKLIGEPTLVIHKGMSAKMTSGGEFKVYYDSAGQKGTVQEGWKKYGLEFSVKPLKEWAFDGVVEVALQVSSGGRSGADHLGSYSAESQVPLVDGGKYLLSVATISSQSSDERSALYLGKIPILGPLLRMITSDKTYRYLSVWVFVEKEQT